MKNLSIIAGFALFIVAGSMLFFTTTESGKQAFASLFNAPNSQKEMVTFKTNFGDIKIKILHEDAPKIAENFVKLAESGKYDNTIFHRVIEDFMIQGGDYENHNGTGGQSWTGEYLEDEFSPNLSHKRGMVSMANKGPNTNGSQFFIIHKDAVFLDGRHSIFGEVVEGMDTVDAIATTETNLQDAPVERVVIEEVIVK